MPTTSSYYNDLEYPTVNEDSSTYGSIINIYLDGLLTKLKAISDRVTNAQAQLGNINRGVNEVDRINTTLSGAIGSSALLPGTNITLLPDPYSGTYTKTTTWPAYTSALSSFSLPTTQSEVANFDYQGFANALTTEVNRIEATVTQAEADILQAQKDTCRAKKYIDVYNSGGTLTWAASQIQQIPVQPTGSLTATTNDGFTFTWNTAGAAAEVVSRIGASSGMAWLSPYAGGSAPTSAPSSAGETAFAYSMAGVAGYNVNSYFTGIAVPFTISTANNSYTVNASSLYAGNVTSYWQTQPSSATGNGFVDTYRSVLRYGTPDLTECENPNPPYFS